MIKLLLGNDKIEIGVYLVSFDKINYKLIQNELIKWIIYYQWNWIEFRLKSDLLLR